MCYIIKVNNDLPDQRSVDVNVYFSFINLIFFVCVCVCGRVCVNVHYNVHQHVEYIYVYI